MHKESKETKGNLTRDSREKGKQNRSKHFVEKECYNFNMSIHLFLLLALVARTWDIFVECLITSVYFLENYYFF